MKTEVDEDDESTDIAVEVEEYDEELIEMSSEEDKQIEMYHCNICDVYFPSVEEHVKEYHNEQSVILAVKRK